MRYETLATQPEEYLSTLLDVMHAWSSGEREPQAPSTALDTAPHTPGVMRGRVEGCAAKVFARNLTRAPGHPSKLLPEYVLEGWYDERLVRTVSGIIQRYLNESGGFASSRLLACGGWS